MRLETRHGFNSGLAARNWRHNGKSSRWSVLAGRCWQVGDLPSLHRGIRLRFRGGVVEGGIVVMMGGSGGVCVVTSSHPHPTCNLDTVLASHHPTRPRNSSVQCCKNRSRNTTSTALPAAKPSMPRIYVTTARRGAMLTRLSAPDCGVACVRRHLSLRRGRRIIGSHCIHHHRRRRRRYVWRRRRGEEKGCVISAPSR